MRLNQRKNNNEQGKQQRELRSTVLEKYKNHIENVIQNSEISFDSIETPGWTSLVNTEQSKFTKFNHNKKQSNPDTHIQILSRLNSLPKLNTQSNTYSNIRLNPSSAKNKNLIVYGSVKFSQTKQNQTPKSKRSQRSQRASVTSKKSQKSQQKDVNKKNQDQSLTNKFLNRFNKNRPNIFYSVEKTSDKKLQSSRKRVQSVRSQPSQNLKQRIQQRLSIGNYKQSSQDFEFERNICTQPIQETINQRKFQERNNFYSLNSQTRVSKDNKNEYFNRYMNKLSLRNKNQGSVKIFKKNNTNFSTNKQNDNSTKMNLIKDKQNTPKRFNTITVHDYLYQDHIKLESKKKVQKMIEESYNKATNFTFTPFISEKSNFLADSKFDRQSIGRKKQDLQKKRLQNCFKKAQKKVERQMKQSNYSVQQQISMKQRQKMSEMIRDRTLAKLFAFLSNNTQQINDKTVQINIEKLPLSLIELIESFLTKIYQKQTFSYKQFMEMFSPEQEKSKQTLNLISRKLLIISQTEKFFRNLGLKKDTPVSIKQSQVNFIR